LQIISAFMLLGTGPPETRDTHSVLAAAFAAYLKCCSGKHVRLNCRSRGFRSRNQSYVDLA
jgi:hypothetical protein